MPSLSENLQGKLDNLPDKPGVYLLKDGVGKVLYVGKAKSLRHRVRAYFQEAISADRRISILINKIRDIEVLVTDSEMEALILEANMIKEYKPRYNVSLKDDKRYPYLKITLNEPFPRILLVRRIKKDKAKYFGPYTNVGAVRQTLRIIRRIFPVRSCNLTIPSPSGRKYRVCLEYYIKRCLGPCENLISQKDYTEIIENVCLFLAGKNSLLIEQLKKRMEEYSQIEHFEQAARIRDQIQALESVIQKQKIVDVQTIDRDIIAYARERMDLACLVLQIREGILIGKQSFYLNSNLARPDAEILNSFLKQYYLNSPIIPSEIYLPLEIEEQEMIAEWLKSKREGKVELIVPQRGSKLALVEMAAKNAQLLLGELLLQKEERRHKLLAAVSSLQKDLYLSRPPKRMAAFDISNLGSTDAVGSLVYFVDGQPKKSLYRRFRIKTVARQDDFAMLKEVVTRYFSGLQKKGEQFPDLVLIDGGKGQLSSAREALTELGIKNLPSLGLAKRLDEVFLSDSSESLMIPKSSLSLRLLQRVRNEAHRFAVSYHRTLRGKKIKKSELDDIPGIGKTRKLFLLRRFGSLEGIRVATLLQLQEVTGIDQGIAMKIYNFFHEAKVK